jgi:hypothetical protein
MPGLIKVGKTTTHPSQRMSDLHSTGVPTPFELEFSAVVDNCEKKEKVSHKTLEKYRVKSNREFFKISVKQALEAILPKLGDYQLDFAKTTYNIEELIEKSQLKEKQKEKIEEQRRQAEENLRLERINKLKLKKNFIYENLESEKSRLVNLGQRPEKKELAGFDSFFVLCFYPVPLGWLVWMGAFQVFGGSLFVGMICIFLLIFGFIVHSNEKKSEEFFQKKCAPFKEIEEKISTLQSELEEIEEEIEFE